MEALELQSSPCQEIMHEAQKLFGAQTLSLSVINAKPEPFGISGTPGLEIADPPHGSDKPDY